MEKGLKKQYGLLMAICMVVGTVVGSGVFFKAQAILQKTNGDMPMGILAWIIGGVIMIFCILAFCVMAQRYEKVNGLVDYAEATIGSKYAYFMGFFSTVIYAPAMTSVLAWLTARYFLVFLTSVNPNLQLNGDPVTSTETFLLAGFILIFVFAVNTLSSKLAGKLQISATFIKLIQELANEFKAVYGTYNCNELLGNIGKGTYVSSPRTAEYYKTRPCVNFVVTASEILDKKLFNI